MENLKNQNNNQGRITIIVDTREKKPWYFKDFDMEVRKLDTADYSIAGMEDVLAIERKGSITDFVGSVISKRFEKELERLTAIKYSFILLEFSLSDLLNYPFNCGELKRLWNKIKIRGKFLLRKVVEIETDYGVSVLFCDDERGARTMAERIIKYVFNKEEKINRID